MALSRRSGARFQGSIWPGFVDAMTALLLVLMFVLSIFMIVQSVLRETITGQESELSDLATEVAALYEALGVERARGDALQGELGATELALRAAEAEIAAQGTMIADLQGQIGAQQSALEAARLQVSDFEAQVARLLAQRDAARAEGVALAGALEEAEAARAQLEDARSALELALAQSRSEIDAQAEAARLAAARREALEALAAELRARAEAAEAEGRALGARVGELTEALSAEEAARLAEAEAARALRARLAGAQDELTAMTLALEEERARAEETLTLLAAARAARDEAEAAAAAQLSEAERRAALLATANAALAEEEARSADSLRQVELLNRQIAGLRAELRGLQGLLDAAEARDSEAQVQIEALGSRLNAALAQVASEQRARARLEAAEAARLAEEAARLKEEAARLETYRSEFFGRLRGLLAGQEGVRIVGDRFAFSSEVLFESASAELAPGGRAQIADVVALLQGIADEIPPEIDWILRVDGHTDDVPLLPSADFRDNWELSQARALSVVRYMIEELGFRPERLAAAGFGQYRPVDPANTPEARAQNRRIELKLTER